ncbi:MAG: class I SAM-dependent methyltransferase, partial [Desulfuromusa sp.]|nr:class I SAM-dependent methyltransferase [Desulfuromusa sp.]
ITCGDLEMMVCVSCGFVFNRAFDHSLLQYGQNYDNNQACSSSFQEHLDGLVGLLLDEKDVRGKQVVEVGCGQGSFLRRLVQEGDNVGVGFDPSYSGSKEVSGSQIRFESRYYDESCTDVPADVVICRHVIEHVPDPVALLRSVRAAIGDRVNAKVYFETPCVDWILRNTVVWDFFYEHCSLFTSESLSTAFQQAGFRVDEVRHVFSGQYLWLEASPVKSDVICKGNNTSVLATAYAVEEQSILRQWQQRIAVLSTEGKVSLWGAGAKGTTFANMIDPECDLIDSLVDLNPNKQGKFVAGSGHPIVDPLQLGSRGVSHAVLMNPNYRNENEAILNRAEIITNLIE